MSDAASPRAIGLVVEAPADAATARILVDRVLRARAEWIHDDSMLDSLRCFRGIEPDSTVGYWKKIPALAKAHGVRSHGHFSGQPGAPDAHAARRALLLFSKIGLPNAVVLLRDADDQPERRDGLEQARKESVQAGRVAIGVAEPEREAWLVAGFQPLDDDERQALAQERQRLGFDPCREPQSLRGDDKRSAKTALANLTAGDHERQYQCIVETPLEHLRDRGELCGLKQFLDEIDERVVPAII